MAGAAVLDQLQPLDDLLAALRRAHGLARGLAAQSRDSLVKHGAVVPVHVLMKICLAIYGGISSAPSPRPLRGHHLFDGSDRRQRRRLQEFPNCRGRPRPRPQFPSPYPRFASAAHRGRRNGSTSTVVLLRQGWLRCLRWKRWCETPVGAEKISSSTKDHLGALSQPSLNLDELNVYVCETMGRFSCAWRQ